MTAPIERDRRNRLRRAIKDNDVVAIMAAMPELLDRLEELEKSTEHSSEWVKAVMGERPGRGF